MIILELPTIGLASIVGLLDFMSALSLPDEIIGAGLTALGATGTAGVVAFFRARHRERQPELRTSPGEITAGTDGCIPDRDAFKLEQNTPFLLVFAGAVAGTLTDLVFIRSAVGYNNWRLIDFIGVALPCAVVAILTFNWTLIRPLLRQFLAASVVGALFTAGQAYYSSVYLPSTTDVSVVTSVSIGAPVQIGNGLDLVVARVTIQDLSGVSAIILTSEVTITGTNYAGSAGGTPTEVADKQPTTDDTDLYPNVPVTYALPIIVPDSTYQELDVKTDVYFARADRLSIRGFRSGPVFTNITDSCSDVGNEQRHGGNIRETWLHLIARGQQILITRWCQGSFVYAFVGTEHVHKLTGIQNGTRAYQVHEVTGDLIVALPSK